MVLSCSGNLSLNLSFLDLSFFFSLSLSAVPLWSFSSDIWPFLGKCSFWSPSCSELVWTCREILTFAFFAAVRLHDLSLCDMLSWRNSEVPIIPSSLEVPSCLSFLGVFPLFFVFDSGVATVACLTWNKLYIYIRRWSNKNLILYIHESQKQRIQLIPQTVIYQLFLLCTKLIHLATFWNS